MSITERVKSVTSPPLLPTMLLVVRNLITRPCNIEWGEGGCLCWKIGEIIEIERVSGVSVVVLVQIAPLLCT